MMLRISLSALMALAACGDDDLADGKLQVTVYGEEFIEDEIPANDVADGWSIDFSRFLVSVSQVKVGNHSNEEAYFSPGTRVFDLAKPSNGQGHVLEVKDVVGGTFDHGSYVVGPAGGGALTGNATNEDVTLMVDGGYSVYVQGTASKGGETIDFAWGFEAHTAYSHCETSAKVDGNTASAQITIHADHLFYDSLVSETPDIRFQLIADADADDSGDVTLAELAAVDITDLENYQVGNNTSVTTLAAFIAAQVPTLGHIDGEGHCEAGH